MSKTFDSIHRAKLIEDLQNIINKDELHLIKTLLNVKLAVKCGDHISNYFDTDTGAPQGDCASATQFTFYLAQWLFLPAQKCLNFKRKVERRENSNLVKKPGY